MQDEEIGSYEAKTHLPALLNEVEKGRSYIITRRGKPVGRLLPYEDSESERVRRHREAIEKIKKLRAEIAADWEKRDTQPLTLEEILSSRHEAHKY